MLIKIIYCTNSIEVIEKLTESFVPYKIKIFYVAYGTIE